METEQASASVPCPVCGLADGEHLTLCAARDDVTARPRRLPMPGLTTASIVLGTIAGTYWKWIGFGVGFIATLVFARRHAGPEFALRSGALGGAISGELIGIGAAIRAAQVLDLGGTDLQVMMAVGGIVFGFVGRELGRTRTFVFSGFPQEVRGSVRAAVTITALLMALGVVFLPPTDPEARRTVLGMTVTVVVGGSLIGVLIGTGVGMCCTAALGTTEVVRPVADNSPGIEFRAAFALQDDASDATAAPKRD